MRYAGPHAAVHRVTDGACTGYCGLRRTRRFRRRQLGRNRLRRALRSQVQGAVGEARDRALRRLRVRPQRAEAGPVLRSPGAAGAGRCDRDRHHRFAAVPPRRPRRVGVEPERRAAAGDAGGRALRPVDACGIARLSRAEDRRPLHARRSGDGDRRGGSRLRWQKTRRAN